MDYALFVDVLDGYCQLPDIVFGFNVCQSFSTFEQFVKRLGLNQLYLIGAFLEKNIHELCVFEVVLEMHDKWMIQRFVYFYL